MRILAFWMKTRNLLIEDCHKGRHDLMPMRREVTIATATGKGEIEIHLRTNLNSNRKCGLASFLSNIESDEPVLHLITSLF